MLLCVRAKIYSCQHDYYCVGAKVYSCPYINNNLVVVGPNSTLTRTIL
jgi:hypothetical protein